MTSPARTTEKGFLQLKRAAVVQCAFICMILPSFKAIASEPDIIVPQWHPVGFSVDGEVKDLAVEIAREIFKRTGGHDWKMETCV